MAEDLKKHARAQGREAKRLNDSGENDNLVLSEIDCPYGPGDLRDAWIAGFGGAKEEVEQVDSSTATTEDVRSETAKTVRKGAAPAKRKSGKGKNANADTATKVKTDLTGNAETALKTTVEPRDPAQNDGVNVTTTLGDPKGTVGDRTSVGRDDPEVVKKA